tara:strand:+ start:75 stop:200 length:126 start_codon:yes stop_codon:yes gene_type:complete
MKMVNFKDLSVWLKLAAIGGIVSLVLNGSYFIVGFFEALTY